MRGLSALLPTLITLWLLVKIWGFLWEYMGRHLVWVGGKVMSGGKLTFARGEDIDNFIRGIDWPVWVVQAFGVGMAILFVYLIGLVVGNLIGRTMWRIGERIVMHIPILRAVYPSVKQVTDYLLSDRKSQFTGSRVVACEPHANGIWSIGLITGSGLPSLSAAADQEMITVFIPSSPTAFSGYVVMVPRDKVIELPLKVDEIMRLLVSGGVIVPEAIMAEHGVKTVPATQPSQIGSL